MGALKDIWKRFLPKFPESTYKLTLTYVLPFLIIGGLLFASLIYWEFKSHGEEQVYELTEEGRAFYGQIEVTRLWNANHGGVYVEVTEDTQPNPYLMDKDRDIVTVDGRRYTKMNPAYMTRQISELASKRVGYKFHLTSLRPINPENKPDEWEAVSLKAFEEGRKEGYTFSMINGERYFRYMAPLSVESPCLRCHAAQGYKLNEVRGGITINIPTAVSDRVHRASFKRALIFYIAVGITSMVFIVGITWALSKKIGDVMKKEVEHEKLKSAVQLAGAAAHELRQPMTVIMGFAELMKEKASGGHDSNLEAEIIVGQCLRMNEIITKMLNITRYKTVSYDDETEIFDLDIKITNPE
jgi:hypothetical protein